MGNIHGRFEICLFVLIFVLLTLSFKVAILFSGIANGVVPRPPLSSQDCGGTLVGDKYVVTAAHCTSGQDPSHLYVRVGDTSLDEEFEATSFTFGVASIIQHPGFNYTLEELESGLAATYENDIAVLVLNDTVSLTEYPNIKPACLPEAGALFSSSATATG